MDQVAALRAELSAETVRRIAAESQQARSHTSERVLRAELDQARDELAKHHTAVATTTPALRRELETVKEELSTVTSINARLRERLAEQSARLDEMCAQAAEGQAAARRAETARQSEVSSHEQETSELLAALEHAQTVATRAQDEVAAETARREAELAQARERISWNSDDWQAQFLLLSAETEAVMAELEAKAPELQLLRQQALDGTSRANEATESRDIAQKELKSAGKRILELEQKVRDLENERNGNFEHIQDLTRQVSLVVTNLELARVGQEPLAPEEAALSESETLHDQEDAAQEVVSRRLLLFRDVREMQTMNDELLRAVRGLVRRIDTNEDVKKAADALEHVQSKYHRLQAEFETLKTTMSEQTRAEANTAQPGSSSNYANGSAGANSNENESSPTLELMEWKLATETELRRTAESRLLTAENRLTTAEEALRELNTRHVASERALGGAETRLTQLEGLLQQATMRENELRSDVARLTAQTDLATQQERRLVDEAQIQAQVQAQSYNNLSEKYTSVLAETEQLRRQVADLKAASASSGPAELAALRTALETGQKERDEISSTLSAREKELASAQLDMKTLRSDMETESSKASMSAKEAKEAKEEAGKFQLEVETLRNEMKNAESELVIAKGELDKTKEALNKVTSDLQRAEANLENAKEETRRAGANMGLEDKLRSDLSRANEMLLTLQKELKQAGQEADRLKKAATAAQSPQEQAASTAAAVAEATSSLDKQISTMRAELIASKKQLEESENNNKGSASENENLRGQVSELEKELAAAKADPPVLPDLSAISEDLNEISVPSTLPETSGLEKQFSAKGVPAEDVKNFRDTVTAAERQRLQQQFKIFIQKRVDKEKSEVEKRVREQVTRQMEAKTALHKKRAETLERTNEDLRQAVRKLKGGVDSKVKLLDNGVMVAEPNLPSFNQQQQPAGNQMNLPDASQPPLFGLPFHFPLGPSLTSQGGQGGNQQQVSSSPASQQPWKNNRALSRPSLNRQGQHSKRQGERSDRDPKKRRESNQS